MTTRFGLWLRGLFPCRKSHKEIMMMIDTHQNQIKRANKAVERGLAALDGEIGWWSYHSDPRKKECSHGSNHDIS